MKKINISNKNSDIISIIDTHFEDKLNQARVKFISIIIVALCNVETVNFNKLSKAFYSESKADSSLSAGKDWDFFWSDRLNCHKVRQSFVSKRNSKRFNEETLIIDVSLILNRSQSSVSSLRSSVFGLPT